jgi:hypothetical protein
MLTTKQPILPANGEVANNELIANRKIPAPQRQGTFEKNKIFSKKA